MEFYGPVRITWESLVTQGSRFCSYQAQRPGVCAALIENLLKGLESRAPFGEVSMIQKVIPQVAEYFATENGRGLVQQALQL